MGSVAARLDLQVVACRDPLALASADGGVPTVLAWCPHDNPATLLGELRRQFPGHYVPIVLFVPDPRRAREAEAAGVDRAFVGVPEDDDLEAVLLGIGARRRLMQAQVRLDPLTGALPREHLRTSSMPDTGGAVVVVDLDHFKRVNDQHGHDAGDRLLLAFCDVARAASRPEDLLFRLGGDEFVLVLADVSPQQAALVAERVRRNYASAASKTGLGTLGLTAGIAPLVTPHGLETALHEADQALLLAKRLGRNRVLVHGRHRGNLQEQRPRVLVVDDDTATRRVLVHVLSSAGFQTEAVGSHQAFLDLASTFDPDVVVLDVVMPEGSGLDLCQQLRGMDRVGDAPVLFVSALGDTCDRVAGLDHGGDDYLVKPFAPSELVARVRSLARRRGASVST